MVDRCPFTPETCMDDICRGSAEQGLCGNWREDFVMAGASGDDDDGDDGDYVDA